TDLRPRDPRKNLPGSERHAADDPPSLPNAQPRAARKGLAFTNLHLSRDEQRLGISDHEGFQRFQLANQRKADFGEVQFRIDLKTRQQITGGQNFTGNILEGSGKQTEFFFFNRQPAGVLVASEFFQMLGAAAKSLYH